MVPVKTTRFLEVLALWIGPEAKRQRNQQRKLIDFGFLVHPDSLEVPQCSTKILSGVQSLDPKPSNSEVLNFRILDSGSETLPETPSKRLTNCLCAHSVCSSIPKLMADAIHRMNIFDALKNFRIWIIHFRPQQTRNDFRIFQSRCLERHPNALKTLARHLLSNWPKDFSSSLLFCGSKSL